MSISLLFYLFYQRSFFSCLCALEDPISRSRRKECLYLELFWSVFTGVCLDSVQMRENTDQNTGSNTDTFMQWLLKETTQEGVAHLVRTKIFPKNWYFLPLDADTYVYVSRGNKC